MQGVSGLKMILSNKDIIPAMLQAAEQVPLLCVVLSLLPIYRILSVYRNCPRYLWMVFAKPS